MAGINIPEEGRQTEYTKGSDSLIGVESNAFSIMGYVRHELQRAGASKEFRNAYSEQAMSGDYDSLLAVSVAFLDADPIDRGNI